jgi:hypothetical protein
MVISGFAVPVGPLKSDRLAAWLSSSDKISNAAISIGFSSVI